MQPHVALMQQALRTSRPRFPLDKLLLRAILMTMSVSNVDAIQVDRTGRWLDLAGPTSLAQNQHSRR